MATDLITLSLGWVALGIVRVEDLFPCYVYAGETSEAIHRFILCNP